MGRHDHKQSSGWTFATVPSATESRRDPIRSGLAGQPMDTQLETLKPSAPLQFKRDGESRGGLLQFKKVKLGDGSKANPSRMSLEQMHTHLADDNLPEATRKEFEKRLGRSKKGLSTDHVVVNFLGRFGQFMGGFASFQSTTALATKRIVDFTNSLEDEGQGDIRFEDYSETLFGFGDITTNLQRLDTLMAQVSDAGDLKRVREMVTDLLIFSSLVPSREGKRRVLGHKASFSRGAIEVLSPVQVVAAIDGLAAHLSDSTKDNDINNADAFKGTGIADKDSINQRLLKMALLSSNENVRQELLQDPTFQALLDSPTIARTILSSTGADEQYFLNTCPLSARNAELAARSSNIVTMLHTGDKLIEALRTDMGSNFSKHSREEELTSRQTVEDLVNKRCGDAEKVFDKIRADLNQMFADPKKFDDKKLKKLKQKWSRSMQKLGGVVNWNQPDKMPHLSQKGMNDHYYSSGALTIAVGGTAGMLMPNTRTSKRFQGPDDSAYASYTKRSVEGFSGTKNHEPMSSYSGNYESLWTQLYKVGGTSFSAKSTVGGHGLFIKAIMRNGVKMFAINDPMQRSFKYLTMTEMAKYAEGKHAPKFPKSAATA